MTTTANNAQVNVILDQSIKEVEKLFRLGCALDVTIPEMVPSADWFGWTPKERGCQWGCIIPADCIALIDWKGISAHDEPDPDLVQSSQDLLDLGWELADMSFIVMRHQTKLAPDFRKVTFRVVIEVESGASTSVLVDVPIKEAVFNRPPQEPSRNMTKANYLLWKEAKTDWDSSYVDRLDLVKKVIADWYALTDKTAK